MRTKVTFFAGFAAGYVLGTRAGRARYEQIRAGRPRRSRPARPCRAPRAACSTRPARRCPRPRTRQRTRSVPTLQEKRPAWLGGQHDTDDHRHDRAGRQQRPRPLSSGAGGSRWHGCAGSTARAPASGGCAAARGSPTSGRTARKVVDPDTLDAHPRRSCCRRPGRTSGSARTRAATSRRSAPTRPAAGSTATTTSGGSSATPRSTSGCSPSPSGCRRRASRSWRHLAERGLTRNRVLAAAFRLLDLGFFRVGGESYAEDNGTYGLATMRRRHVTVTGDLVVFDYVAKSGKQRVQALVDDSVRKVVAALLKRDDREQGAAGLPGPHRVARRHQRRHQRLPARGDRRGGERQGLPHLARDRAHRRRARRVDRRRRRRRPRASGP